MFLRHRRAFLRHGRWPKARRKRAPYTALPFVRVKPRLAELWRDIWRYDTGSQSPEIEHVLALFRRSFDWDFLDPEQRSVVLVSLVETMLGRFRPPNDPVQLEALVEALVGTDADVAWFAAKGRKFRNRVAHGDFTPDAAPAALESLSRVVSRIVLELIKTWNGADAAARRERPSDLLIVRATTRFKTGRR